MMDDFEKELAKNLRDPEFKAEWDAIQPELAMVQAMIEGKEPGGMPRQEPGERTGEG